LAAGRRLSRADYNKLTLLKITKTPPSGLAFGSNKRLNFNLPFETGNVKGTKVYTSETRELIRRGEEPIKGRLCPNCGRPMHLWRNSPGYAEPACGVLPDLRRYWCGECGVAVTQEINERN
jgi:hypothetical protein